ncbi:MAG: cyclase family protein [Acidimicrobiales bacterium]|jgi:kynurenine formamidase
MSAPTPSDRVDAQGPIPAEDVVAGWFHELSNWGRWGSDDELGTLNLITPAVRRAAAALVSEGESVSCAWDIDTSPRPDQVSGNPLRHMLSTGQGLNDPERPGAEHDPEPRTGSSSEWIGLAFHGYSVTHLDSLCHMFLDGRMYNDRPAAWVTAREGALANAVTAAGAGITTRGVLLDVAAHQLGDDSGSFEPGRGVLPHELDAAAQAQGVEIRPGDAVLLRTGYGARVRSQGPDDMGSGGSRRAGWHAACLPWLHQHDVAMIGADTAQDVVPSGYVFSHNPIHSIGIVAMGLWLLDNCDLEPLAETCRRLGRWDFHLQVAPLRVVGGTGSPVNPIATF